MTTMLRDPELAALLDQALRNVETLELLVYSAGEADAGPLQDLRDRLAAVKAAYTRETDALTREVLKREIDRRVTSDRRRSELQHT
ncbi:MAG TPA: hypothetical protein VFK57_22100 [Vicinamibacterales bacterium]|nr:hypothetical protein [Vicinamibacterales bacterium]